MKASSLRLEQCRYECSRFSSIIQHALDFSTVCRTIKVSPLVSNPGRVVLTSARRLYYQPYNSEPWPVLKVRFCEIDRVVRRRYLLQNSALEIYFKEAGTTASIKYLFLALGSQALCNELFTKLESRPMSEPAKMSAGLDVVTLQWQHGVISNFDYILYLNRYFIICQRHHHYHHLVVLHGFLNDRLQHGR